MFLSSTHLPAPMFQESLNALNHARHVTVSYISLQKHSRVYGVFYILRSRDGALLFADVSFSLTPLTIKMSNYKKKEKKQEKIPRNKFCSDGNIMPGRERHPVEERRGSRHRY